MNINTTSGKKVTVSETAFGRDFNEPLVHQVVNAYMAGGRQGSKAQKSRSDVSGGGRKPWRQKGTGRARAGTIRSPIWRSGGVTFAASPRDHSQKVNKKMYRGAMQCIVSELVRQERLVLVEDFTVDSIKTKKLVEQLKSLELNNVLIVTQADDTNLNLSARNIPHVEVIDVQGCNPVDLISFDKVLMTVDSLKKLDEELA